MRIHPIGPLTRAVCVVATAGVLASCVSADDPGVAIKSMTADVVFGVDVPEKDPTLPGQAVGSLPETGPSGGEVLVPPARNRIPERYRNLAITASSGPEGETCATAPLGEAPDREAPETAENPPAEGLYRWKRSGEQKQFIQETGDTLTLPIAGFERRLVRSVEVTGEGDSREWTFEVVRPHLGGAGTIVTTYRVKPAPVQRGVTPPYVGERRRVSEPSGGVSLLSIEEYDREGNRVPGGDFNPANPVLLLPLPVATGETYESVGVDSRSGKTLVHEAQVTKRQSVDACGTRIDGWTVESTQTLSGTRQSERAYTYIVNTDNGGLIISEKVEETTPEYELNALFEIGQVEPSPATEEGS